MEEQIPNVAEPEQSSNHVFIHAVLDDFGLTAAQFRVYCHIARRAGMKSCAFASLPSMAKACRLDEKTVRSVLKTLVRHQLILRQDRYGTTSEFRLTSHSDWISLPKTPVPNGTPTILHPCRTAPIPKDTGDPSQTALPDPSQKTPTKYIPVKLTPLKDIPGLLPAPDDAETIYQEYPKKVKKKKALKAIREALKQIPFPELLDTTKAFAARWRGHEKDQYLEHPATWFNGECYNEDPETWSKPNEHSNGKTIGARRDHTVGFAGG